MEMVKEGMMAVSRAGHDRDTLYLILKVEGAYVYLAEGRLRPIERPKKKKQSHVQVIKEIPEAWKNVKKEELKNEDIRRMLKEYQRREKDPSH